MVNKPYHHGNLRNEMIEKGLEYIGNYGVESLSMRKLADSTGVSSAAPYAHFQNKEDFLDSVESYITDKFSQTLRKAISDCKDKNTLLLEMGISYVLFFYKNPLYYQFLFNNRHLDLDTYEPFKIYHEVASLFLGDDRYKVTGLWALVHGLAQLASSGFIKSDDIEADIRRIIMSM